MYIGGIEGMKALSVHPYYAMAIVSGQKSIEVRSWDTNYRGDILICSTAKKYHGTIPGHALGVVTLQDVRRLEKSDLNAALMTPKEYSILNYAWVLTNNRLIKPVPVKGKLSLWEYDGDIEFIPYNEWLLPEGANPEDEPPGEWFSKYWEPLLF